MIFVVAVLLIAVAAAATVFYRRWRAGPRIAYTPIPLVFPMNAGIDWDSSMTGPPPEPPRPQSTTSSFAPPPPPTAQPARTVGERSMGIPITLDGENPVAATSETVRFVRPADEVVQLLPGHLEVVSGDERHQEIRFVRVQGQQPQLILGRNPGRSPQHIALNSSTVSRQHARLAYSGGKWAVANLSKTNPVVVNDQELTNLDGERQLADGDRIELGEVVLRFHAH
ncbi:MAG TPA: FHA domain-containing protein [Aeromicrobium sp.]|nr:FHA domain-containing protein [Aeromicrobium sp.]